MTLTSSSRWTLVAGVVCWLTTLITAQSPPAAYLRTPSERQLQWHRHEYYAFVHFGPNTFTNEEWGRSQSTPDVFNPTALDTDQWAKSFADAGMAGMILTAKHHDGMALWDTNTTTYKIGNGKWAKERVEKGLDADVVRMAAASAKKYNIKFGIYLSPWDMHRDPSMPKKNLTGTIYDEPQIFGDNTPGNYNDLYASQLTELITMTLADGSQIELFELWLDGASGSSTVQTFSWTRFRDLIRTHQPSSIMWGHQGVDARWVGNEDGVTVSKNWHTISRTQDSPRYTESQLQTGIRDGLYWTPAEADARLRTGWFHHTGETSKSAGALLDMYMASVGQSINLNLDIPPSTTGQIPQADVDIILQFRTSLSEFLNRDILTKDNVNATASSVRGNNTLLYGAHNILDGLNSTYWTPDPSTTQGSITIDLDGVYSIDAFILQEHIALGQRIGGYGVDVYVNGAWKSVVEGESMGYKRIHRLKAGVETGRVRVRVGQANDVPVLQSVQALGVRKVG